MALLALLGVDLIVIVVLLACYSPAGIGSATGPAFKRAIRVEGGEETGAGIHVEARLEQLHRQARTAAPSPDVA